MEQFLHVADQNIGTTEKKEGGTIESILEHGSPTYIGLSTGLAGLTANTTA